MDWGDIVDVEVDITLFYNPGGGTQQSQSIKRALVDWDGDWKADMIESFGDNYRDGIVDMAENLSLSIVNDIYDDISELILTKVVNFQGSVTLTYIKGTTKNKTTSIAPELAHLSNEMIAGKYNPDSIKSPIQTIVRRWVADAMNNCIISVGG